MGHCLLTSGLALEVSLVSESETGETSVIWADTKFLVFLSAASGIVVVAAELAKEKFGSLRMRASLETKSAK